MNNDIQKEKKVRRRWVKASKLFLDGNPISAFIECVNDYSLEYAQFLYGEQKKLIRYLDKKEKSL